MITLAVSRDDGTRGDVEGKANEAKRPASAALRPSRVSLDHLGQPLRSVGQPKFRYARTYTVLYDTQKQDTIRAEKQWRLLKDAMVLLPRKIDGLETLFHLFQSAAPSAEHSYVSWSGFESVLEEVGVHDPILTKRLFDEFCDESDNEDPSAPPRIDFRHFMHIVTTMVSQPVEARVSLLFDVWDADMSGTLSHSELVHHFTHGLPVHKIQGAIEAFNQVWTQIRAFNAHEIEKEIAKETDGESFTIRKESKSSEVTKAVLLAACRKLPAVRYYMQAALTRTAPKADVHARRGVDKFHARLRELDAQVMEEFKYIKVGMGGASKDAYGEDDNTSRSDDDLKHDEAKTKEILRRLNSSQSQTIALTRTPHQEAVIAARQMRSRPATAPRQIHSFVDTGPDGASMAQLQASRAAVSGRLPMRTMGRQASRSKLNPTLANSLAASESMNRSRR